MVLLRTMLSALLWVLAVGACSATTHAIDRHAPPADAAVAIGPDAAASTHPDAGMLAPDSATPSGDPRFAALSDAVRADLAANEGATAVSVAVWLDGEVTWVGGFGSIDPSTSRPPGEDTLFMIGSDTKKLTALSLLRRVQAGRATLDTTIAEVLPELTMRYAPDFTTATIRQLLSNQGGIVDGTETSTSTTDEALERFAFGEVADTYYSLAPPGILWNYSNTNFSIAGLLDQRLDGRMWADIVEQDLFAPLGMRRTFARKSEVDADHAPGFGPSGVPGDTTDGPVTLEQTWESAFSRPAGLVWSTPSDQMRLAAFLVDGNPDVLSDALRRELVTPQINTYPDLPGDYGFGISLDRGSFIGDQYYSIPVWSHGGDTLTHSSTFFILPEQRFAISILSNSGGDDFSNSVIAAVTSLVALPAPAPAPPTTPLDPTALDALTGTYVDANNLGNVIVTRSGDALALAMPALDDAGIPYQRLMEAVTTRVWLTEIEGEPLDFAFIDGPLGETYFRNRAYVAIRPPPGGAMPRSLHGSRELVRPAAP